MKYVDAIKQSKADAELTLAPARAEQEAAKLGIAIAELGLKVKTQQNKIEELKGQFPLPVDAIVLAGDDLALDARRLDQLSKLKDELFGS